MLKILICFELKYIKIKSINEAIFKINKTTIKHMYK